MKQSTDTVISSLCTLKFLKKKKTRHWHTSCLDVLKLDYRSVITSVRKMCLWRISRMPTKCQNTLSTTRPLDRLHDDLKFVASRDASPLFLFSAGRPLLSCCVCFDPVLFICLMCVQEFGRLIFTFIPHRESGGLSFTFIPHRSQIKM